MAYITRADGEHFVIPSYRDVISAKQKTQLKKEILTLSQSYGEYITLHKKGPIDYEVAFSPDTGYLLGESIWQHFKRPMDFIYCEAVPDTTEAILVIVKDGSVYLDGSFPVESIPEELVIFLTQENHFQIYIYGDVPISEQPEEGKFSFDTQSVSSFTALTQPVFPTLALLKQYQLQPVDAVLKLHGIGVLPIRPIIFTLLALGVAWFAWKLFLMPKAEVIEVQQVNPYQSYIDKLNAPDPAQEIQVFLDRMSLLSTMPGWTPMNVDYANGSAKVSVISQGGNIQSLIDWASREQDVTVQIAPEGISLKMLISAQKRAPMVPLRIFSLKDVIVRFTDNLAAVYPGNHLKLGQFATHGLYMGVIVTLSIDRLSPAIISLVGEQFSNLPIVISKMSFNFSGNDLSGTITLEALGIQS